MGKKSAILVNEVGGGIAPRTFKSKKNLLQAPGASTDNS
jgi:hypothetical protein